MFRDDWLKYGGGWVLGALSSLACLDGVGLVTNLNIS